MDLKPLDATPTAEERAAVDAIVGPPANAWDGGPRGSERDYHTAVGGKAVRDRRHELIPALHALQGRVGWISEGGLGYVCERLGVPPADAWGVATFYALFATTPRPKRVLHVCDDVGCRNRGASAIEHALETQCGGSAREAPAGSQLVIDERDGAWMHSPCLGLCDAAPAALLTVAGEQPAERLLGGMTPELAVTLVSGATATPADSHVPELPQQGDSSLVLLKRCGTVDPTSLVAYVGAGGFTALAKARAMGPDAVIGEVIASKLVGRGGAAFPTGRKWDAVRRQPATPHYLVCNADESEPGTFKDRVLLTQDPFALVEAMTIAAFATGASKAYLYIRAEYPLAADRMANAIAQTRAAGHFHGEFDIEIRRGAGAYICGEETALFESIEGKRGEPRSKPPFPAEVGLFGKPTVVNNVETLMNVLPIILDGGTAYAGVGSGSSTGTRLFCLSGAVAKPGVYEVPMGTNLRDLLDQAGAGPMSALLLGGAAGTFIRPDEIDLPLTLEAARAANTTLGSGVVMVFAEGADLRDMVLRIAGFFRDESCGQCVPCRVGTVRQEEALHRITRHAPIGDVRTELALLDEIGSAMRDASICGLGQTAYSAVESAIKRLGLFEEQP